VAPAAANGDILGEADTVEAEESVEDASDPLDLGDVAPIRSVQITVDDVAQVDPVNTDQELDAINGRAAARAYDVVASVLEVRATPGPTTPLHSAPYHYVYLL